jgi:CheY-like chemotaxis protein
LELSRRRPDLVLMDEILPGESSLDLLVEIQALSIPVLLVTGVEEPTHEIPPGVAGRLKKPGWDSLKADQERFRVAIFGALGARPGLL